LHELGIDIADADGHYARRLTVFHTANGFLYTETRGQGQSAIVKIRPEGGGFLREWDARSCSERIPGPILKAP
jgi:hypothetical protein